MQSHEIRMESLGQIASLVSTVSLEPQPIPLQVKLVLLGDRRMYYLLSYLDPEFSELFKVAVDFDDRMDRNLDSQQLYARLIGTMVSNEKLLDFDTAAVARVIEHSARMLEDSEKISLLIERPGLRTQMGACALATLEEGFTEDKMIEGYERVFERAVEGSGR